MSLDPPNWQPVSEPRTVRRFVQHDSPEHPDFAMNFRSDEEAEKPPLRDEHPDHRLGMSVYDTEEHARAIWAGIAEKVRERASARNKRRGKAPKLRIGDYIADVELQPGNGFELAGPPDERGHMTLRGNKDRLAVATKRVYAAHRDAT
ncbi:MAG TPA: hypothetical protein VG147_16780 [Solirubrobacteraceae bacterium]|nr:hypothetical protein [Solirubrobacteraceae bacterium]